MFLVHEKQLTDLKYTAQKMMFSIKDFSRKCDQFPRKLQIWSHLLEKSLTENFNCCVVIGQRVSKIFWERLSFRSSLPEVFLQKGVPKISSKFTGEHPSWRVISIKLQRDFIETTHRRGCSSVNLLHISEHLFLRTLLVGCFWSFSDVWLIYYFYDITAIKKDIF